MMLLLCVPCCLGGGNLRQHGEANLTFLWGCGSLLDHASGQGAVKCQQAASQ